MNEGKPTLHSYHFIVDSVVIFYDVLMACVWMVVLIIAKVIAAWGVFY